MFFYNILILGTFFFFFFSFLKFTQVLDWKSKSMFNYKGVKNKKKKDPIQTNRTPQTPKYAYMKL